MQQTLTIVKAYTHYIEWIMQQEWWRFVKVSIKNTIVMHTAIWLIIQVIHTKSEYITNECKIFNSSVRINTSDNSNSNSVYKPACFNHDNIIRNIHWIHFVNDISIAFWFLRIKRTYAHIHHQDDIATSSHKYSCIHIITSLKYFHWNHG